MSAIDFFRLSRPFKLAELAEVADATIDAGQGTDGEALVTGVASLEWSRAGDLTFFDNPRYAPALEHCKASVCLLRAAHRALLPAGVVALVTPQPYRAMTAAMAHLFPQARRPESLFAARGVSPGAAVHPTARLEPDVTVDPGALIGPNAEVGAGTTIGAYAVIGPGVRVGRDCSIGAQASLAHALLGDRVVVHPGARLGQDGFGFALDANGHLKTPQIGRVIVQNDVEIGANTTIDRGSLGDTVIGEGCKIDNLVQIGHNVMVGRGCVIAAQTGVAGSCEIGDFAMIGGQAAIAGHLRIGERAAIAAKAGVMRDVPDGARYGGAPAQPMRRFLRGVATLDRLARRTSAT
jgi:UDP-3-O-[3-hydroxymyristoyl] glucosamine N-acyltransferase